MDLRNIPKVELHCHLEACFQLHTVKEIGQTLSLDVPEDPERFRREWLITEPVRDLETALKKFANIQKLWGSEETIERLTYEACEYGVAQNIRILELRYSPDFIRGANAGLSFDRIHEAVVRGITRAKGLDISVGLIGIVQKTLALKDARYTTDFIINNKGTFAGIDMADMDIGFDIRRFAPLMLKAKQAGLHVTLHSGEENVPDAPQHVRVAVEELGAERIGHGIYIANDPEVMELVKRKRVMLELCPTSNLLTNSVPSVRAHPLRRLMEAGVRVSINSDDPHLFGIDLCHEYEVVQQELGITPEEFDRINDDAAACSFLPLAEKQRVWPRGINHYRDGCP